MAKLNNISGRAPLHRQAKTWSTSKRRSNPVPPNTASRTTISSQIPNFQGNDKPIRESSTDHANDSDYPESKPFHDAQIIGQPRRRASPVKSRTTARRSKVQKNAPKTKRKSHIPWRRWENELLVSLYADGHDYDDIGNRLPDRSIDAMKKRHHKLVNERAYPGEVFSSGRKWTKSEDELLVQFGTEGQRFQEICDRLPGRSKGACAARFNSVLGRASWTDAEDEKMLRLLMSGADLQSIVAELPGRTATTCTYRLDELKKRMKAGKSSIRRNQYNFIKQEPYNSVPEVSSMMKSSDNSWSAREKHDLRSLKSMGKSWKEIGQILGRSASACRTYFHRQFPAEDLISVQDEEGPSGSQTTTALPGKEASSFNDQNEPDFSHSSSLSEISGASTISALFNELQRTAKDGHVTPTGMSRETTPDREHYETSREYYSDADDESDESDESNGSGGLDTSDDQNISAFRRRFTCPSHQVSLAQEVLHKAVTPDQRHQKSRFDTLRHLKTSHPPRAKRGILSSGSSLAYKDTDECTTATDECVHSPLTKRTKISASSTGLYEQLLDAALQEPSVAQNYPKLQSSPHGRDIVEEEGLHPVNQDNVEDDRVLEADEGLTKLGGMEVISAMEIISDEEPEDLDSILRHCGIVR